MRRNLPYFTAARRGPTHRPMLELARNPELLGGRLGAYADNLSPVLLTFTDLGRSGPIWTAVR
jgi:hypothetical protein